ncbi:MAG: hypothetical protein QOI95_4207 [Acidimicrobiaceae bacterium]|jgi:hypothetical protein
MTLDAGAFVDGAVASTGLDDFGEGPWRDGLEVFCDALNREANLNAIGVAVHEGRIGHLLAERLRIVDWHRRHPSIGAEEICRPVIVVGLPRTGTTALAHLLAADPDSRALRTWEATAPTPPPEAATEMTDPRIAATQAGIDMSHQLMPDLPRLYFATATSPSETLDLTGMSFRAFQAEGQAHVPSYEAFLLSCDMTGAYEFQRKVQQLLQWRCPPARWAWKNPPDLLSLPAVRAVFPDATFIWTHRDPFAAMSSVCSLIAVVRSFGTDEVDGAALGPRQTDLWAEAADRGLAAREQFGDEAFVDVWMDDLVRDPIGTMGQLYDRLRWPLTAHAESAMRAWLAGNPQHGRGGHDPSPAEFGLDEGAVRERFASYLRRFGREDTNG